MAAQQRKRRLAAVKKQMPLTPLKESPVSEYAKLLSYLTNPAENNVWLKIRSGLIRPGEHVEGVVLSTMLQNGAVIKMKIMAYVTECCQSVGSVVLNTNMYTVEYKTARCTSSQSAHILCRFIKKTKQATKPVHPKSGWCFWGV